MPCVEWASEKKELWSDVENEEILSVLRPGFSELLQK